MNSCYMTKHYVTLTLSLLVLISVSNAQNKPLSGKAPSWITANPTDYNKTALNNEAEDGYIDLDFQKQVSLATQSVYIKAAYKILSEAGVQNMSQLSFYFDPTYQSLTIHTINIIRDGQVINKLDLTKVKTIQEEPELDRFIYNGTMKSVLFLEDVRKNDIIEYSFTQKGFNPVFQNKYSDFYNTTFSAPQYHLYYKLIVPAGRTVNIRNNVDTLSPSIHTDATQTAYEWTKENVHALHQQDALPSWYDPYGNIMVSEYKDWKEVNSWATKLFPSVNSVSTPLQKKIEEINAACKTDEEKVKSALHFVQDDVRYMGLEMGVHSHLPATPDKVFARRFGDCKEKSYLLVTMLRKMGIQAYPVLINASYTKAINNWLPSPDCFNHTTVKVILQDGEHWFDPTISYQRGSLKDISYPDYKAGLVITDTTSALTTIALHEKGDVNVKEIFTTKDMLGKAKLKVITDYKGSYADDLRDQFNSNSNYELLNDYKQFYQAYFSGIAGDSLTYTDDSLSGTFTTTEYYTIDSFWSRETKGLKNTFTSYVINSVIKKPKDKSRTMPFYLTYPAKYHEVVEVNLPEDWDLQPFDREVNCTGFKYKAKCTPAWRKITLTYDFENLKDAIPADEASLYFSSLKDIDKGSDYEITTYTDNDADLFVQKNTAPNTLLVVVPAFLLIGSFIWFTQKRS
jgi:transglutaminase-like putative cysteine protease